jgi:hypothetical protein
MLNTLMMGIIAQEVAKTENATTDTERFKEILMGSPLTPIEEIALMGVLSTICASGGEKGGILSMFNL